MKERIKEMILQGSTYNDIIEEVGCSKSTISYHARKMGMSKTDYGSGNRYDWEEISRYYETHTFKETREKFGFAGETWSKAIRRGDIVSRGNEDRTRPLEDVMVENSDYQRTSLKQRLLKDGILANVCSECGQEGEWNGKPLVMHLDHINGVSNDHRLENLRMLCPNCHSQTETYAGRNAKKV